MHKSSNTKLPRHKKVLNSAASHHPHLASTTSKCLKYLVPFLNLGPHFQNAHGIGIIATVMKPNRLMAHEKPSRAIICAVKRGKQDEMRKRMKVEAASTEAP
jgi:hypothetical protein